MKRSKLYNNLIRACRAEISRIDRQMQTNRKKAQRAIGHYKKELDESYLLLQVKKDYWTAEMQKAYKVRDRARSGERQWAAVGANRMPEGYQHP